MTPTLGLPLRFTVSDNLKVQGIVVLPKGALVYGEMSTPSPYTPDDRAFRWYRLAQSAAGFAKRAASLAIASEFMAPGGPRH